MRRPHVLTPRIEVATRPAPGRESQDRYLVLPYAVAVLDGASDPDEPYGRDGGWYAHQLSEALAVPYAELMRLSGYPIPGEDEAPPSDTIGAALFADITEDERDELLEYLAWYRSRGRARRAGPAAPGPA